MTVHRIHTDISANMYFDPLQWTPEFSFYKDTIVAKKRKTIAIEYWSPRGVHRKGQVNSVNLDVVVSWLYLLHNENILLTHIVFFYTTIRHTTYTHRRRKRNHTYSYAHTSHVSHLAVYHKFPHKCQYSHKTLTITK